MRHEEDDDHDANEQTKDVYAHFGLAMYFAQVLEYAVVNSMVIGRMRDRDTISRADIDAFREAQFERTLGQILRELRRHIDVPPDVEPTLRTALKRRNWLAHHYFRERSVEFMSADGRATMLAELQEATALFRAADESLDQLTRGIREKYGIDDAAIEREMNELIRSGAEKSGAA